MTPVQEVTLTCGREIRKDLRSAKGLVLGLLFLLAGITASLIYIAISHEILKTPAAGTISVEEFRLAREQFWSRVWDPQVGQSVSQAPWIFIGLYKATLWFIPFLTLLIGFDQVCGDLQHRTIRYTAIRLRRSSIVVGKALAVWLSISGLLLALNAFVWCVSLVRGDATFAEVFLWGTRMWAFSSVFAAAYSGLTILISSCTRRPILALLGGLVVMTCLWVGDMTIDFVKMLESDRLRFMEPAGYAFPDFYEQWLVTPRAPELISALAILLGFGAATTALAAWLVNRRDI